MTPSIIEASSSDCSNELTEAVYYRKYKEVSKLIKAGENPNCHGRRHFLLVDAAEKGDIEGMKVLLSHGAAVEIGGDCWARALSVALRAQQKKAAEFLFEQGAFTHDRQCSSSCSFLKDAIYVKSIPIIKKILSLGMDINECPAAIVEAAQRDFSILRLLLRHGADPNSQNNDGESVLFRIAWSSDVDLARLLIKKGANPNLASKSGATPLHQAVQNRHGDASVSSILLKHGADPNSVRYGGITPLFLAAEANNAGIVQLLVEHGADVNWVNARRQTVLDYLKSRGYSMRSASVRYLKRNGAKSGPSGNRKSLKKFFTVFSISSVVAGYLTTGLVLQKHTYRDVTDNPFRHVNYGTTLGILSVVSVGAVFTTFACATHNCYISMNKVAMIGLLSVLAIGGTVAYGVMGWKNRNDESAYYRNTVAGAALIGAGLITIAVF